MLAPTRRYDRPAHHPDDCQGDCCWVMADRWLSAQEAAECRETLGLSRDADDLDRLLTDALPRFASPAYAARRLEILDASIARLQRERDQLARRCPS